MMRARARWRLIVDGDPNGAVNMARDVAILDGVITGAVAPTVRFYGWRPACLSLGRHQGLHAADLDFCTAQGIDVVRRPTGGRAVLHHLELTYSVVAPLGDVLPGALQEAYRRVCGGLVRGARSVGVAAELTGGEVNLRLPGPGTAVPCFKAPAGGEVVVAGRKIIGSSARVRRGCLLQHGAILLDWDGRLQAGAMGLEDDRALRPLVTTFLAELGCVPARSQLVRAFTAGFEAEFAVALEEGCMTPQEASTEHAVEYTISMCDVFS